MPSVSPAAVLELGGDWLVTNQNDDGGWDWPAPDEDRSRSNAPRILAPTAMGLVYAYRSTGGHAGHLFALEEAGQYLLAKTAQQISPEDGYLAVALDEIFEVSTYTDFVKANFYEPLEAGTYDYYGDGTLLVDTLWYIIFLRVDRTVQGVPNLAALDLGMGLYAANLTGAETQTWIAGVKSEINELDEGDIFDVLGLAGAVFGLAAVGEDFDPNSGSYAAAESLADLAEILAGYQLSTGGFTWNGFELDEELGNETVQETAIAALALNQFAREMYEGKLSTARMYLESVQLPTGAWEDYVGGGTNDEVTGEALWAVGELTTAPLLDDVQVEEAAYTSGR